MPAEPSEEIQQFVLAWKRVTTRLQGVVKDQEAIIDWMLSSNTALNGSSPSTALLSGREEEVMSLIGELEVPPFT